MRQTIAIATAAIALAATAAAEAHVTVQPEELPAGGFARVDVRVPNESDSASTTKVAVKFPPGFTTVSTELVPGWTAKVTKSKLAKPQVNDEGEKVTDRVDTITWTANGSEGKIGPDQFQDFGLSIAVPDKPNSSLTFKALQTYSDGEVVRWIGPPDAEEPAPQVKLTAATGEGHHSSSEATAQTKNAANVQPSSDSDDGGGAPTWLAVLALALGVAGLLAGISAMVTARRQTV